MNLNKLALSLLVGIGTGCTNVPPAPVVSMSDLPNCFDANYDRQSGLFTIKNAVGNVVNQQCLLTVVPRGDVASASQLAAGKYRVYLANGGGGGAGGTLQAFASTQGGGGGGGGGAGAVETQATVNLTEGVYKLTIGAGGPGGTAGALRPDGVGGGPGWAGSPTNIVRVATGEVVLGSPGADTYARLSRAQSDRAAGPRDAHGGSGPGQASGGRGSAPESDYSAEVQAQPGASRLASGRSGVGGAPGEDDQRAGTGGGGGGATSMGHGGVGGGESPGRKDIAPERGSLGSGGGGGEGSSSEADPGARGGHGYIALRPI